MEKDKTNLYLLAIVSIVAIVGIVVLIMNAGSVPVYDDMGNIVGMTSSVLDGKISMPHDRNLWSDAEEDLRKAFEVEMQQTYGPDSASASCYDSCPAGYICCKCSGSSNSCLACATSSDKCK